MSSRSFHRLPAAHRLAAWLALVLLAGCASRLPPPQRSGSDGPEARPPAGLDRVPDAVPRVEPLRSSGPNKPYEVLGQRYWPLSTDQPLAETGLASWYGRKFHGLPTANGETYDMYAMTAAHKTMPLPSYARVRNPANGREVIVRVNDRGPFAPGRVVDLSYTAALKLGLLGGVAPVEVTRLTHADIRAGNWRSPQSPLLPLLPPDSAATVAMPSMPRSTAGVAVTATATTPAASTTAPAAAPASMAMPTSTPASAPTPAPAPASTAIALIDDPAPGDDPIAAFATGGGWWLQLGAFRTPDGAAQLQQRLLRELPSLPGAAVFGEAGVYRVQAGPYASRESALAASGPLQRATGVAALIVQRELAPPTDASPAERR